MLTAKVEKQVTLRMTAPVQPVRTSLKMRVTKMKPKLVKNINYIGHFMKHGLRNSSMNGKKNLSQIPHTPIDTKIVR